MTTSNHMAAGALIAVSIKQPLLVLPLSLASHFILDSIPHFGYEGNGLGVALKHKLTYVVELLDFAGVVLLIVTGIFGLNLALLSAVVAISPDFEWLYRFLFYERKGLRAPDSFMTRFHQKIQWCERPLGFVPEIIIFIALFMLLIKIS